MITAYSGPIVVFGQAPQFENNTQIGPSAFAVGTALIDVRNGYEPGQPVTSPIYGWYGTSEIPVINQTPSTLATNNIAAAQAATAGTPLTLVSSSGAGITVGASAYNIITQSSVTGVLAIDGAMSFLPFGQDGSLQMYDPTKAISRAVTITSAGNDSSGFMTVAGYDIYGQPMTQRLAMANVGAVTTTKCFKYIASCTPSGTISGSNISVGTSDVYGFPLRADSFYQASIVWNGSWITANSGFTAAVTTSPATSATGDVRGSYAVQSASNGTKVLQIALTPSPNALATGSLTGLAGIAVAVTGVTQV